MSDLVSYRRRASFSGSLSILSAHLRAGLSLLTILGVSLLLAGCPKPTGEAPVVEMDVEEATATITVSPQLPSDIPGGAADASLSDAAAFAWQEFISLTWPAVAQTGDLDTRGQPNASQYYGDPSYSGPLAWETYRHKVEIYPGTGDPPGYVNDASQDYGYDALKGPGGSPLYVYEPSKVGTADGTVVACDGSQGDDPSPWINLDETTEIGVDAMFAGIAPTSPFPGQQFLFLAKAGRNEYTYTAANGWWATSPASTPIANTKAYVAANQASPPAGSNTCEVDGDTVSCVSFDSGTIELKTGWRQLTADEASACGDDPPSGSICQIRTATVRYYEEGSNGDPCYRDATWGMAALHIIHKTPSAPYFIYATFEQADNLLTSSGDSVEDVYGNLIANQGADPMTANITSKNAVSANPATADSIQQLSPSTSDCTPGDELYLINTANAATPQGVICVNRRIHTIPSEIIAANENAQSAISSYNNANGISSSVWQFYKLVNVQYQPLTKSTPGEDYSGPDIPTYYLSNSVVETDYNLQVFSGQFQPSIDGVNTSDLITDFNTDGTVFHNVYDGGDAFLMGGCMGCHGNAQVSGSDFSFIFGFSVAEPEVAVPPTFDTPAGQRFLARMQPR